jgi:beta-glucosidase
LENLVNAGIKPVLTVHHFTSPLWISDPEDPEGNAPGQLGGLDDLDDRLSIVGEFAEHAAFLAAEFGHLVDDYATFNEPAVALLASQYLFGTWPPNISDLDSFMQAFRTMADAHAAMYDGIKAYDECDADGDGLNATVGITIATGDYVPVNPNNIIHWLTAEFFARLSQTDVVRFFIEGFFDANLNTIKDPGEEVSDYINPDGRPKIDWMGVQHYFRMPIRLETNLGLPLNLLIPSPGELCLDACPEPAHPSFYDAWNRHVFALDINPVTGKSEYNTLLRILRRIHLQVPDLPLIITENGLYTNNPVRRAQLLVRTLEQVHRAIQEGIDVRGYIHWSLMDNWEWGSYTPKFGLYQIDRSSPNFDRVTNIAVRIYAKIAKRRFIRNSKVLKKRRRGPLANEYSDVSGYVWYDLNGDGIRNRREPGAEGIVVRLFNEDGTPIMTNSIANSVDVEMGLVPQVLLVLFDRPLETKTDRKGYFIFDGRKPGDFAVGLYAFDGLNKGEYLVQFEIPDGYQFTVPNRGRDSRDSDVVSDTVIGEAAPIQLKTQGKNFGKVGAGLVQ